MAENEAFKHQTEPINAPINPLAIIALKYGDCGLQSPFVPDDHRQREILRRGSELASSHDVPLIIPRGLENILKTVQADYFPEDHEVECIPVDSKTDEERTTKALREFFRHASQATEKTLSGTVNEAELENKKANPIIVVADRISIGGVRHHCKEAGLLATEVVDCSSKL